MEEYVDPRKSVEIDNEKVISDVIENGKVNSNHRIDVIADVIKEEEPENAVKVTTIHVQPAPEEKPKSKQQPVKFGIEIIKRKLQCVLFKMIRGF